MNFIKTLGLHSDWMDESWSCHRCSRWRRFAFVAQGQDVFLQVCDPALLDRQRAMKHFFTEPEQQHREGDMSLIAFNEVQLRPSNIKTVYSLSISSQKEDQTVFLLGFHFSYFNVCLNNLIQL